MTVTADPAEGEASTEAGDNLVETVPMPDGIIEALEAFIAEHHVERPFYKRQRDRDGQPGRPQRSTGRPAMSDAENFVARWSRLKRETAKEKTETGEARSGQHSSDTAPAADEKTVGAAAPPAPESLAKTPFDPASLPPITPSQRQATSAPFCNPACQRS